MLSVLPLGLGAHGRPILCDRPLTQQTLLTAALCQAGTQKGSGRGP